MIRSLCSCQKAKDYYGQLYNKAQGNNHLQHTLQQESSELIEKARVKNCQKNHCMTSAKITHFKQKYLGECALKIVIAWQERKKRQEYYTILLRDLFGENSWDDLCYIVTTP
jgi:hypothetical protein